MRLLLLALFLLLVSCVVPKAFQKAADEARASGNVTEAERIESLGRENAALDWGEIALLVGEIALYVGAGGAGTVGVRKLQRKLAQKRDENLRSIVREETKPA